jgi:alkylation response protein AidB-like acyl-CoA dehydrogenase
VSGQQDYLARVAAMAPVVRADAADAERNRTLGDKTVAALRDAGLLRMMLPAEYGGASLPVGQTFAVCEALARINGSAGWNLSIGLTTFGQVLGLNGSAREQVLGDSATILAGSINFTAMNARRVEGGYVFDGRASFLSGSAYANWLVVGGLLHRQDTPVRVDGVPTIVRGVTPVTSVESVDVWRVSGMRATASNDAPLNGLFIPDRFICAMDHPGLADGDPAAGLPLLSRFGAGLAFVGLGTARGALDALVEVAAEKIPVGGQHPLRERADVQIDAARALGLIEAGRSFVWGAWTTAESAARAGHVVGVEEQVMLRLSYATAAEYAENAADLVFRAGGSSSLFESNGIERAWRDTHAVTKHAAVSARAYDRIGKLILGLPHAGGPI